MIDVIKEKRKISANVSREPGENPDRLLLEEWLTTLEHFGMKCAYCQDRPYEVLDHFVPIGFGGLTTVKNCIPACKLCNDRKGHGHPDTLKTIPRQTMRRVRAFLATRQITPRKIIPSTAPYVPEMAFRYNEAKNSWTTTH